MTQAAFYRALAAAHRNSYRGQVMPDLPCCPCGEPRAVGQTWVTEWYDRIGLVERFELVSLCEKHKARKPGELT